MPKPFYHWLPEWVQKGLKKRYCSQCKTHYSKKDVVAFGLRQTDKSNECAIYVEHICSSCKYRALTIFGKEKENSLEGMCCNILESIKRKKLAEKSKLLKNHKKGVITDKEVNNFLKFIKGNSSHEDFLKEIGINLPKDKNKNKDKKNDTS